MVLGETDAHDMWSEQVHDTFRVFLGHCGVSPRVALFVADGNGLFGLTVDIVRLMQLPGLVPAILVVGVGYPDARTIADTVDVRRRDLAPAPGGGDAFLRFFREELRPWLARRHRTTDTTSIFFGHSLGGLFGVHALLTEPPTFDHHVISSPSLWWDRDGLCERARRATGQGKVFLGIGARETDEGRRREAANLPDDDPFKPPEAHLDMVDDLTHFTAALRAGPCRLDIESTVFADEYHATVAPVVLTHGLRHIFR